MSASTPKNFFMVILLVYLVERQIYNNGEIRQKK